MNPNQSSRHKFVVIWLLFILITNVVGSVPNFNLLLEYKLHSPMDVLIYSILDTAFIVSLFLLFFNKKIGFGVLTAVVTAIFIFNLFLGEDLLKELSGFAVPIILYAVLQLKNKEGITAWNYLV